MAVKSAIKRYQANFRAEQEISEHTWIDYRFVTLYLNEWLIHMKEPSATTNSAEGFSFM